jgi:putative FmdB family regulatory protein
MPVYVFACPECGPFELARPMAEAGSRVRCPACERQARRVFTPPRLARLAAPVRRALEAEEASAHEPRVVTEKRGRPLSAPGTSAWRSPSSSRR